MRDIQFRAWDTKSKQMYPNVQNHINDEIWSFGKMLFNPDRFHVMQYTGFKDKNGKGIYEGDYLEHKYGSFNCVCGSGEHTDELPDLRIVEYDEDDGSFCWGFADKIMTGRPSGLTLCKSNCKKLFEVIGSIHENPELLTQENK